MAFFFFTLMMLEFCSDDAADADADADADVDSFKSSLDTIVVAKTNMAKKKIILIGPILVLF